MKKLIISLFALAIAIYVFSTGMAFSDMLSFLSALPVFAWTGRTAGQVDADSPVDETLMVGIDADMTILRKWVGGDGALGYLTESDGHGHNGTDSLNLAAGAVAAVNITPNTVTKLTDSVSHTTAATSFTLLESYLVAINDSDLELTVSYYLRKPTGSGSAYARVVLNGAITSTGVSTTSASVVVLTDTPIDISSLSTGVYVLNLECKASVGATATNNNLLVALTG